MASELEPPPVGWQCLKERAVWSLQWQQQQRCGGGGTRALQGVGRLQEGTAQRGRRAQTGNRILLGTGEQNSVRNGPLEEKCVPASGQGQSEVARASRRGLVPRKDDAQGVIQGSRGGRGLCRGLGLLSRAAELC